MLEAINHLKAQLDDMRPLPSHKLQALASVFRAEETEYIFESNALEGNTLTLAETELVLDRGLTVSGKPLKDHLEATNHRKAFEKLKQMAKETKPLHEDTLRTLHELVLRGINDTYAGRYRDVPVRISGSRHIPPNHIKVPVLMEELGAWFEPHAREFHPVHAAADLHLRLSQIHPFVDGNGRVCRLAMNLHLLKNGYPLTIIRSENNKRVDYYHALAECDASDRPDAFRTFVEGCVLESLNRYLTVMAEAQLD